MESYIELVVETLTRRRLPLVRDRELLPPRRRRAICARSTTSASGSAHDYLGLGVGAVSTIGERRWRNAPSLRALPRGAAAGGRPPRELEQLVAAAAREPSG